MPAPVLQIYGDIGENFWEPELSITGQSVAAWLKQNADGAKEVTVRINSYGGWVSEGVAIRNLLATHGARITTVVDGFALSAASVIAMGGDEIQMLPGTMLMIHEAAGGCWGNASDMETTANALRAMSAASAGIYADRTEQSLEKCQELMAAETWMQASEAKKLGFCDKVVSGKRKETAPTEQNRPGLRADLRFVQTYKNAPQGLLESIMQQSRERAALSAPPALNTSRQLNAARSPFGELAGTPFARLGDR